MYVGRDFDPMDNAESDVFGFNFVNDLQAGDSIVSAVWNISVADDSPAVDPTPSARLMNTPWLYSPTITLQRIVSPVVNVKYVLQAVCNTNSGSVLSLFSYFRGEAVS